LVALALSNGISSGVFRVAPATTADHFKSAAHLVVQELVSLPFGPLSYRSAVDDFERGLLVRCAAMDRGNTVLIVATEDITDAAIGCVEVGLWPPPQLPAPTTEADVEAAAAADTESPRPFLTNLVVTPQGRRRGIGTRLVQTAEQCARRWGHSHVCFPIDRANEGTRRLMESRMGYEPVCIGSSEWYLSKALPQRGNEGTRDANEGTRDEAPSV